MLDIIRQQLLKLFKWDLAFFLGIEVFFSH